MLTNCIRYTFDDIEVMTQEQFDSWFARQLRCLYDLVEEGGVTNIVTSANKLTRRILLQQDDWHEWNESEFIQLDQYAKQHMLGEPCKVQKTSAVFNLIWTYVVTELDGRKKARCTCDGSTRRTLSTLHCKYQSSARAWSLCSMV